MQGCGKQLKNICKSKKEKVLPWQHLLPGFAEKLISSSLCRDMESKEPIKIFISPRNKKKVLPWQHLLPGIIEKLIGTNPCRGLECKEHRERLLSPRNKKKCWQKTNQLKAKKQKKLPWQHLLPIKTLISSNPCRGLECKEPQKDVQAQ